MTEPIKITSYDPSHGMIDYSKRTPPQAEGIRLLFIPLLVLTFVAGLFIGVKIEKGNPIPPAQDPRFVNIEGHEGEILVVRGDSVEWTTEAALHEKAGHG